jgi:hypothetical protein
MGEVDLYGSTRAMMKRWMPNRYVSFKFNDMKTSGVPDMGLAGNHVMSWWEFKYDDEDGFEWEGIQHLTCCRLDRETYCRYVVYRKAGMGIYIVKPTDMNRYVDEGHHEHHIPAKGTYDHYGLVQFMRKVHRL